MTGLPLPQAPKVNGPTILETKALRLIAAGFDQALVAHQLGTTQWAIQGLTMRMRRRLGAKNLTHLIYLAVKRGWID